MSKQTTRKSTARTARKATPAKAAKVTPAKPSAKKAPANCGCGCGAPTVTSRATFLAGHDARFAGQYGRGEIAATPEQMAILEASPKLQAKVDRIVRKQAEREAAKAARVQAKAAAKVAFDEAMAKVEA